MNKQIIVFFCIPLLICINSCNSKQNKKSHLNIEPINIIKSPILYYKKNTKSRDNLNFIENLVELNTNETYCIIVYREACNCGKSLNNFVINKTNSILKEYNPQNTILIFENDIIEKLVLEKLNQYEFETIYIDTNWLNKNGIKKAPYIYIYADNTCVLEECLITE